MESIFKKIQKLQKVRGFTLVELIVAMGLFGFVSVTMVGATISVLDGNRKAQATVRAMDALSFALESMAREIRVGNSYNCSASPTRGASMPYNTNDCSAGGTRLGFVSSDNEYIIYDFNSGNGTIRRCKSNPGDNTCNINSGIAMTGDIVDITDLTFYVQGSAPLPGDEEQPRVTMTIEGTSGSQQASTDFNVQTTITQRFPDF